MTVKELREQLDKYPDDLIVEIGFNPTFMGSNNKVIVMQPQFEIATKYDSQGCEAYKVLRIS